MQRVRVTLPTGEQRIGGLKDNKVILAGKYDNRVKGKRKEFPINYFSNVVELDNFEKNDW